MYFFLIIAHEAIFMTRDLLKRQSSVQYPLKDSLADTYNINFMVAHQTSPHLHDLTIYTLKIMIHNVYLFH